MPHKFHSPFDDGEHHLFMLTVRQDMRIKEKHWWLNKIHFYWHLIASWMSWMSALNRNGQKILRSGFQIFSIPFLIFIDVGRPFDAGFEIGYDVWVIECMELILMCQKWLYWIEMYVCIDWAMLNGSSSGSPCNWLRTLMFVEVRGHCSVLSRVDGYLFWFQRFLTVTSPAR